MCFGWDGVNFSSSSCFCAVFHSRQIQRQLWGWHHFHPLTVVMQCWFLLQGVLKGQFYPPKWIPLCFCQVLHGFRWGWEGQVIPATCQSCRVSGVKALLLILYSPMFQAQNRAVNAANSLFICWISKCFLEQVGGRSERSSSRVCLPVHLGWPGCLQEALLPSWGLCWCVTGVGEDLGFLSGARTFLYLWGWWSSCCQAEGWKCWRLCCWSCGWGEKPLRNENNPSPALSLPVPVSPGVTWAVPGTQDTAAVLSPAAADWEGIQLGMGMCS